jgi:hypothetical protein
MGPPGPVTDFPFYMILKCGRIYVYKTCKELCVGMSVYYLCYYYPLACSICILVCVCVYLCMYVCICECLDVMYICTMDPPALICMDVVNACM